MARFLALYCGPTLSDARLVAISSDEALVVDFAERLLADTRPEADDPVVASVDRGRRAALKLIAKGGDDERPR